MGGAFENLILLLQSLAKREQREKKTQKKPNIAMYALIFFSFFVFFFFHFFIFLPKIFHFMCTENVNTCLYVLFSSNKLCIYSSSSIFSISASSRTLRNVRTVFRRCQAYREAL